MSNRFIRMPDLCMDKCMKLFRYCGDSGLLPVVDFDVPAVFFCVFFYGLYGLYGLYGFFKFLAPMIYRFVKAHAMGSRGLLSMLSDT